MCSGYGIAAQALTAVVRAHDGRGQQTMLTDSILKSLCLSSPDELIGYFSHESCYYFFGPLNYIFLLTSFSKIMK